MLIKLLKNDLKKNMRWFWIVIIATIGFAGMSRGFKELGTNIGFFKVVSILFDSVFYSLLVNVIVQPFIRNLMNFSKSFYGDESYLTHTLPVTKKQLVNSKFITAIIEMGLGFLCVVVSLLIRFASQSMFDTLKLLLSMVIGGDFSAIGVIILFVTLVLIQFLMFISIIYFSIVLSHKSKEKRLLKTFLFTLAFAFASLIVLDTILIVELLIYGVDLTSSTLVLSSSQFLGITISGIVVYMISAIVFYLLTQKEFGKGVNVD